MMVTGIIIMGISAGSIFFIETNSVLVWGAVLFMTRVGAAMVEILRDSYFYKQVDGKDVDLIDFFRTAASAGYIFATLLSAILLIFLFILCEKAMSQPEVKKTTPRYDLNTDPVLYTVGYAHLDTQWRWDYEETINKFIKATMDDNFALFEKFKSYVFTFILSRTL